MALALTFIRTAPHRALRSPVHRRGTVPQRARRRRSYSETRWLRAQATRFDADSAEAARGPPGDPTQEVKKRHDHQGLCRNERRPLLGPEAPRHSMQVRVVRW